MPKWILTAALRVDSGTQYVSDDTVTVVGTDIEYEARVESWGLIDRSLPTPAGIPQIGDATIRMNDTDHRWRSLLSHQTPRRRIMELRLTKEGESLAASGVIYSGEIMDVHFPARACEVKLRDALARVLDEVIPAVVHRDNFPELVVGTEAAFLHILNGRNASWPGHPQGVIPLPHIGFDSATGDRWGLAMHEVSEVTAIFRKLPGAAVFTVASPSLYVVTVEERTFIEYPGQTFRCTFIDFDTEQPPGTEMRADCDGYAERPEWNGIAAASGFEVNRNAVNFFLNLLMTVLRKLNTGWDVASVQAVLNKLEVALPGDSVGESRYLCDAAITSSMTVRALLARWVTSFQIDFCADRRGRKRLGFLTDADPSLATFKEGHLIARNSFEEDLAKPTLNRAKYRFQVNYATGEWGSQPVFDNLPDQQALGDPVLDSLGAPVLDSLGDPLRIPKLEEDVFDLWFVRDPFTAVDVTARWMSFLALGSYRQTWQMPLPEVYGVADPPIELAAVVGLTHSGGLEIGGYVGRQVKVIGLALDLSRMVLTARSILRVPQVIVPPVILPFVFDADAVIAGEIDSVLEGTGSVA